MGVVRDASESGRPSLVDAKNAPLAADLNTYQRTMLRVALSFFTWRTLTAEVGLARRRPSTR
jgi:hypothetical protein